MRVFFRILREVSALKRLHSRTLPCLVFDDHSSFCQESVWIFLYILKEGYWTRLTFNLYLLTYLDAFDDTGVLRFVWESFEDFWSLKLFWVFGFIMKFFAFSRFVCELYIWITWILEYIWVIKICSENMWDSRFCSSIIFRLFGFWNLFEFQNTFGISWFIWKFRKLS